MKLREVRKETKMRKINQVRKVRIVGKMGQARKEKIIIMKPVGKVSLVIEVMTVIMKVII